MIDRKIELIGPNMPDINGFHFVCAEEREAEARDLLNSIYGVQVFPESKPVNYVVFGSQRFLTGNLVAGICYPPLVGQIRSELKERYIADWDEDRPLRVLQRKELWEAYGTLTGFRKWSKRR